MRFCFAAPCRFQGLVAPPGQPQLPDLAGAERPPRDRGIAKRPGAKALLFINPFRRNQKEIQLKKMQLLSTRTCLSSVHRNRNPLYPKPSVASAPSSRSQPCRPFRRTYPPSAPGRRAWAVLRSLPTLSDVRVESCSTPGCSDLSPFAHYAAYYALTMHHKNASVMQTMRDKYLPPSRFARLVAERNTSQLLRAFGYYFHSYSAATSEDRKLLNQYINELRDRVIAHADYDTCFWASKLFESNPDFDAVLLSKISTMLGVPVRLLDCTAIAKLRYEWRYGLGYGYLSTGTVEVLEKDYFHLRYPAESAPRSAPGMSTFAGETAAESAQNWSQSTSNSASSFDTESAPVASFETPAPAEPLDPYPDTNPANGMPMIQGSGIDVCGNVFGTDSGGFE